MSTNLTSYKILTEEIIKKGGSNVEHGELCFHRYCWKGESPFRDL